MLLNAQEIKGPVLGSRDPETETPKNEERNTQRLGKRLGSQPGRVFQNPQKLRGLSHQRTGPVSLKSPPSPWARRCWDKKDAEKEGQ